MIKWWKARRARCVLDNNGYCPKHIIKKTYYIPPYGVYDRYPSPGWCDVCRSEEKEKKVFDVESAMNYLKGTDGNERS